MKTMVSVGSEGGSGSQRRLMRLEMLTYPLDELTAMTFGELIGVSTVSLDEIREKGK